jgi:putative addiction module component (TIGR02574 family)
VAIKGATHVSCAGFGPALWDGSGHCTGRSREVAPGVPFGGRYNQLRDQRSPPKSGCRTRAAAAMLGPVTKAATKILTDALALTPEERMVLAAELLASVHGPADPDWEPAWQAELDRRAALSDASVMPAAEWSEVRARVLGRLAPR